MDQSVGRLLKRLDETGASENTLVLFLADNGGCAEDINRSKAGVQPIAWTAYAAGFRISDVVRLDLTDLDRERCHLHRSRPCRH